MVNRLGLNPLRINGKFLEDLSRLLNTDKITQQEFGVCLCSETTSASTDEKERFCAKRKSY